MSSDETYEHTSLEAARWLVSLEESPDDQKLKDEFERWLSEDPTHREAWDSTSGIYDLMGPLFAKKGYSSSTQSCKSGWRHTSVSKRILYGVPIALAAAVASFMLVPDYYYRLTADYSTGKAQKMTVKLADGSEVSLAPKSAINVVFRREGDREIHLLRGEGFFKVSHNPERPFRVTAGKISVTDIGTEFDVRVSQKASAVAVRSGEVHVDGDNHLSTDLHSGQRIERRGRGIVSASHEDAENIGAWATSGQLVLEDSSFGDAVTQINPYYNGRIFVANRHLSVGKVTGVYNLSTPESALKAMADTQGAKLYHITPWIIVVSY